ncbi:MAG: 4Fe-4S binding protein, partial [Dehalococcoidales bacterium]|nr:4Fe-4S binding protein [Dehalococcoidales bacterium]
SGLTAPTMRGWSKRFQVFADLCKGCGTCETTCPNGAIAVQAAAGRAWIDDERCLTCGYCTTACPEFAIRVV